VAVAKVGILRPVMMKEFGQFRASTASALVDRVVAAVHSTQFYALKWG